MSFSTVIFDLDGTLLDTSSGIYATANRTIEQLGMEPVVDEAQLSKFIGPPIYQCFVDVYDLDPSLIDEAIEIYRKEYDLSGRYQATPYSGIKETLDTLQQRGYRMGVATLKYQPLARLMLEHFGLASYFEVIYGSDDASSLSKADIITSVLSTMEVAAAEAVLIGDTVHDENGAQESGVAFIAVDYGFGFAPGESKSSTMMAMAQSASELLHYL